MSAATVQGLPALTPEQEAPFWAAWDALQAAKANGDVLAEIEAHGALIDWQMAVGLLTREELRARSAPYLLKIVGRLGQFPGGRVALSRLRDESMALLSGDDYAERAGASLFILTMDGVQNARRATVRARRQRQQAQRDRESKRQWRYDLERVQDGAEGVAQVLWSHAFTPDDDGGPSITSVDDFREAWRHARGVYRRADGMLRQMGATPGPEPWFFASAPISDALSLASMRDKEADA